MRTKPLATAGKLLLTENQVWPGMTVELYLDGNTEPEKDENGKPLKLTALIGGIPARKQFFPEGSIQQHNKVIIICAVMEGFLPNVRFCPSQTFSLTDAPPNTRFAVFMDGTILKYPDYKKDSIVVRTTDERRIISDARYAYNWWQCEYKLPEAAVLVPLGEIGSYQK